MAYTSKFKPKLWCGNPVGRIELNRIGVQIHYKNPSYGKCSLSWEYVESIITYPGFAPDREAYFKLWKWEAMLKRITTLGWSG